MDRPLDRPGRFSTPAIVLALVLVLAACAGGSPGASAGEPDPGGEPSGAAPSEGGGEAEPTPGTSLTACELVTPADIEAALDFDPGTVAEGTLEEQPTVLDPAVNECRYEDEAWGGLVVYVTPTDGVNVYDALESVYGDTAEALDIGDGAFWFEDNDRGYFLQGSVMVQLQFTFLVDPVTSFRDPTIAVGEAAVAKI